MNSPWRTATGAFIAIVVAHLLAPSMVVGGLFDDFNDNLADPTKWATDRTSGPAGISFKEQSGRLELLNTSNDLNQSIVFRDALLTLRYDDHRASADMLSRVVGTWGHDVRRAYDAVSGLAQAAAFWPDVLLFDIIMPSIREIQLANDIRRQPRLKNCFIVAVTDRTDKINRRQRDDVGIDLFLIKPIDLSNLQTLLTRISEYRFGIRTHRATQHANSKELPQREVEFV